MSWSKQRQYTTDPTARFRLKLTVPVILNSRDLGKNPALTWMPSSGQFLEVDFPSTPTDAQNLGLNQDVTSDRHQIFLCQIAHSGIEV